MTLAVAVVITAGILAAVSSHSMLVFEAHAVSRSVIFVALLAAGIAVAGGHLLSRRSGRLRDGEWAVVRGVVASWVLLSLLGVPLVGFFVLLLLYALLDVMASPIALAVVTVAIAAGGLVLQRGEPPIVTCETYALTDRPRRPWTARRGVGWVASTLLTAGVITLTAWVLGWGFLAAHDDVVVAHNPDGCTAVVRQIAEWSSGEAVLYVAAPGSAVAHRRTAYPLEETLPFGSGDYVLEAGEYEVRIVFDNGLGGADEVVSCRQHPPPGA
jgi:hypothetical protein